MKIRRIVQQVQESKGLGDLVAIPAEPIKQAIIKHAPAPISKWMKDCKCDKRREFLNRIFPIK